MKLEGKTVLITGGSSGIGLEMARQLLARSCVVVVTGRSAQKLEAAKALHRELHVFQADVTEPDAIVRLHADVMKKFPALDVLVNNAGIMRKIDMNVSRGLADVTQEIDVNLSGPIRMIQQFLPDLKSRDESLIVNVSSGLAFVPLVISPVYSATKAAMHSFTQCLREQLIGTSVAVVELAPPVVETALYREEFAAEAVGQKGMSTEVLVRRAIAGIEAGREDIRPGLATALSVMGRVAPTFALKQLAKSMKPKGR
jgi:uncharacterized oxidoreductase